MGTFNGHGKPFVEITNFISNVFGFLIWFNSLYCKQNECTLQMDRHSQKSIGHFKQSINL